jgi:hypothetical protein
LAEVSYQSVVGRYELATFALCESHVKAVVKADAPLGRDFIGAVHEGKRRLKAGSIGHDCSPGAPAVCSTYSPLPFGARKSVPYLKRESVGSQKFMDPIAAVVTEATRFVVKRLGDHPLDSDGGI